MTSWADIVGRSRRDDIVLARHAVMYLLWRHEHPSYTLQEIGEVVGGRTPATVHNAIRRVGSRLATMHG